MVLAIYPAVAFFPYNFQLPRLENGVRRGPGGALSFQQPGIALTARPPGWLDEVRRRHRLELELQVRSFDLQQAGPARILTISRNTKQRNLTLGQRGNALDLRLRTPATNENGRPAVRIPRVFRDNGPVRLRVRVEPRRLRVEVDGQLCFDGPLPPAPLSGWEPSFRLALGNELSANRPWLGEVSRAALKVGGRQLDYLAPGAVELPRPYWFLNPAPRLVPFRQTSLRDMAVNLLGFIPLGVLLALRFRRRRRGGVTALLAVLGLTLALELVQLLLPHRFTSTTDVLLNTLGGAAGIAGALVWLGRQRV